MALFRSEVTLRTLWTADQVRDALSKETKPGGLFAFDVPGRGGDVREFRGEVKDRAFRVVRRVQWRNSFTPVVEGQVRDVPGGSELRMSLFVHPYVLFFIIGWTAIAAATVFVFLEEALVLSEQPALSSVLVLLPFLGAGIAWLSFRSEVPRIERWLRETLPPWVDPASLPKPETADAR